MARQSGKAKEITFIENAGDVTVKANGVSVEIRADGSILAYTNGSFKVCPVANDDGKAAASVEPRIGDKMPDGTVLAGISPNTKRPMYATPADAALTMNFDEAKEYAARLEAHGHPDWRVPSVAELNVLFNNRAAIGGFNVSGSDGAGWYWSSLPEGKWDGWGQQFSSGKLNHNPYVCRSAVRCVR